MTDRRVIVTTVTDLAGVDVGARRLEDGDVSVKLVNQRGTELNLRGTRMVLLTLLDSMRESVVLLEDADR